MLAASFSPSSRNKDDILTWAPHGSLTFSCHTTMYVANTEHCVALVFPALGVLHSPLTLLLFPFLSFAFPSLLCTTGQLRINALFPNHDSGSQWFFSFPELVFQLGRLGGHRNDALEREHLSTATKLDGTTMENRLPRMTRRVRAHAKRRKRSVPRFHSKKGKESSDG